MRRKKVVAWLVGLLIIGIACRMIPRFLPHERLLLSRSSLVAQVDQLGTYNWQSDYAILLFRRPSENWGPWSLEKINLLTGQHIPYPALAKQLEPKNTAAWDFETSLDGKWLIWKTVDLMEDVGRPHATGWLANLKTGHTDHFPVGPTPAVNTSPHDLHWMADSKHWAEFDFPQQGGMTLLSTKPRLGPSTSILRDVNTPHLVRKMKIRSDWDLDDFATIMVLSEEQVVATTFPAYHGYIEYSGRLELIQTGLTDNASPTHRPLPLPDGTQVVSDVVFSPQGDRVAMAAIVDSHPAWMDVLRRWHLPIRIPSHPQVGIWIFSLDGRQKQLVGQVTPERDNSQGAHHPYEMPGDLRWSPDGKQLGFVYKENLYRVPSD